MAKGVLTVGARAKDFFRVPAPENKLQNQPRSIPFPTETTITSTPPYDGLQRRLFDRLQAGEVLTPFFQNASGKWVTVTPEEWKRRFFAALQILKNLNLAPGAKVAIVLPDHPAWDLLEKSCWALGLNYGGFEPYLTLDSFDGQFQAVRPDLVVIGRENHGKFSAVLEKSAARPLLVEEHACFDFSRPFSEDPMEDYGWPAVPTDRPAMWSLTSGTTGTPKPITYTYRQVELAAEGLIRHCGTQPGDRTLAWLPLASLFQRVMNICAWISGVPVYFLEDPRRVAAAMRTSRPTVLIGVPRFYEKVASGFEEKSRRWFLRLPGMRGLTHRFFRRIFGGKVRMLFSGSAACPGHVLELFERAGLPILEAYGMSENILPIAANAPGKRKLGSVGKPLQDVRVSPEGEVQVRGECLFAGAGGYPGAWTEDGYFRTGDLGHMDGEGFLFLEGRLRDLIKTSRGRQISPVPLEADFKAATGVPEVVILGNNRDSLYALVYPGAARDWRGGVERFNEGRAFSRRVQAVMELKEGLTLASGFLTSNFKYRRHLLEKSFAGVMDAMDKVVDEAPLWELNTADHPLLAGWRNAR